MKTEIYIFLTVLLFLLGAAGSLQLRFYGDNTLILALLVASIAYAAFVYLSSPTRSSVYVIALFTVGFSILFAFALRSNYVSGNDINWELYEAKRVIESGHWAPSTSLYSSCLSITILPAIVSSLTGIDPQVIFKFMYPFLLSLVPVTAFTLYRKWLGKNLSFVVSMFLIASTIYLLQMPSLARQIVAMLLFVLTINMIIKDTYGRTLNRTIVTFLLIFGVIASHYTTGLLLIGVLFLLTCYPYLNQALRKVKDRTFTSFNPKIYESYFIFALVLGVVWYWFVSEIPFEYTIMTVDNLFNSLSSTWGLASRSPYALQLVGVIPRVSLPNIIGYWLGNVIRGLIVAGMTLIYIKRAKVRFKIRNEFFLLGVSSVMILVALVALPYLSSVYNIDRLYLNLLFFMLPFLAVVVHFISPSIRRVKLRKTATIKIVLALIMVAQMVYSTGLLHQVVGFHSFVVLNPFDVATQYDELSPDARYYISDSEAAAIHWMAKSISPQHFGDIIADENGRLSMASQGSIPYDPGSTQLFLTSSFVGYNLTGKYFYLRYDNIKYNKSYAGVYLNVSYAAMLHNQNKLFDNGKAQVFYVVK